MERTLNIPQEIAAISSSVSSRITAAGQTGGRYDTQSVSTKTGLTTTTSWNRLGASEYMNGVAPASEPKAIVNRLTTYNPATFHTPLQLVQRVAIPKAYTLKAGANKGAVETHTAHAEVVKNYTNFLATNPKPANVNSEEHDKWVLAGLKSEALLTIWE